MQCKKTSALCKVLFLKKIKKNQPKPSKMVKKVKNYHFGWFFMIFFGNATLQRAEVFCVEFSASRRFFRAIKNSFFWQFFRFFIIRGDPCDLGGVKIYRHSFARSKIKYKNCFGIRRTSLTPWHMVEIISVYLVGNLIALLIDQGQDHQHHPTVHSGRE